ncbi:MAG: aminotransferase class III-fold pyridoxal phosphate-dependent enzyme [candidate division KSB1 bacterium]|nr:aminotransferase class III-fold pyridoxal phosphate-dependent enzyme [candidate division KSB1 bacterium]
MSRVKAMCEEVRARPLFSCQDAERVGRQLYGLAAQAVELPSERDRNFLLRVSMGEQYVLKVANLGASRLVVECQNKAMRELGRHGIPCPQPLPTRDGQDLAEVEGRDGQRYLVRLVTYLPGAVLAVANPHTPALLRKVGALFGAMDRVLASVSCRAFERVLDWDLARAPEVITKYKDLIPDPAGRSLIEAYLPLYEAVSGTLAQLRRSLIHNDGNDYNILVGPPAWDRDVVGVLDFGDMLVSYTVAEVAVVSAYAMLGKEDPVAAAAAVVAGYHQTFPLHEDELQVLYPLICMRLCLSACIAAYQKKAAPDNEYLSISEAGVWDTLWRLREVSPQLAHYRLREACGLEPCPKSTAIRAWLAQNRDQLGPVISPDALRKPLVLDLSVGGSDAGSPHQWTDVGAFSSMLWGKVEGAGATVGIGRYDEARPFYTSPLFRGNGPRTVHLGLDLFLRAGEPVLAPLDGVVHSVRDNSGPLNYGPTLILRHPACGDRPEFYVLFGHLSRELLQKVQPGMPVQRGQVIGRVGSSEENGGWPPHLHVQLIADLLGFEGDFPGVAAPDQRAVWRSICPDPSPLLGEAHISGTRASSRGAAEVLELRRRFFSPVLSVAYRQPLQVVRGYFQYLYDEEGRPYLDAVNNVPIVGHCHPRVVEAACRQMMTVATNTRYVHEKLVEYAERLTATLPEPLRICFFVCSGSEANELALRLARAVTGGKETIVLDGAYHGNTTSLIEISPYKFNGPGGQGAPAHVRVVPTPDRYRGLYRGGSAEVGRQYAHHVGEVIAELQAQGKKRPIFICESLMGCAGQIVLPESFLAEAFKLVRASGGVCIADEVQVGFARVGSHFWGFQTQNVVPDIVTMGKPIGNGFPLGAVVTTPEVAAAFDTGMEYFNTFGGNPVACAVGLAVLDVIAEERLQENAHRVGAYLLKGLGELMERHPIIGDVRGKGLFIGVELVRDREEKTPATEEAAYVVERMKEKGILIGRDGPFANVLKIKPPLVFTEADAERLVTALDQVLDEDFVARS